LSIKTAIVDLDAILTPERPEVPNSVIEALANTITQLKGLIHLPILKAVGIDEYELLLGQLEFYAYLQARTFDESLPDRLTVLIVDKKAEDTVYQQFQVVSQETNGSRVESKSSASLDISNLENKLNRSLQSLEKSLLEAIEQKIPRPITVLPMLEVFNQSGFRSQVRESFEVVLGQRARKKIEEAIACLEIAFKNVDLTKLIEVRRALTKSVNGKRNKIVSDEKLLKIMENLQAQMFNASLFNHSTASTTGQKSNESMPQVAADSSDDSVGSNSADNPDQVSAQRERFLKILKQSLLTAIEQKIPQPVATLPILEAFDRVQEEEIKILIQKNLQIILGKTKAEKVVGIFQAAKEKDKKLDLTRLATVREVLTESRNGKSTKLVSDKKILEIMESWN
jgi:hypothetical protein